MATALDEYNESLRLWMSQYRFKRGIEIGLAWGYSTRAYLETQDSPLISIDINDCSHMFGEGDAYGKKLDTYGDRWTFILGDSAIEFPKLKGTFDYIYIDGDHRYNGVKKDLEIAVRKLSPGGFIVCDDYGHEPGVKMAVDEICQQKNLDSMPMDGNPNGGRILCRNPR